MQVLQKRQMKIKLIVCSKAESHQRGGLSLKQIDAVKDKGCMDEWTNT